MSNFTLTPHATYVIVVIWKNMKAKFRCLRCEYEYEDGPGPTTCPECGHIYIKWVDYEEWKKSIGLGDYKRNCHFGFSLIGYGALLSYSFVSFFIR